MIGNNTNDEGTTPTPGPPTNVTTDATDVNINDRPQHTYFTQPSGLYNHSTHSTHSHHNPHHNPHNMMSNAAVAAAHHHSLFIAQQQRQQQELQLRRMILMEEHKKQLEHQQQLERMEQLEMQAKVHALHSQQHHQQQHQQQQQQQQQQFQYNNIPHAATNTNVPSMGNMNHTEDADLTRNRRSPETIRIQPNEKVEENDEVVSANYDINNNETNQESELQMQEHVKDTQAQDLQQDNHDQTMYSGSNELISKESPSDSDNRSKIDNDSDGDKNDDNNDGDNRIDEDDEDENDDDNNSESDNGNMDENRSDDDENNDDTVNDARSVHSESDEDDDDEEEEEEEGDDDDDDDDDGNDEDDEDDEDDNSQLENQMKSSTKGSKQSSNAVRLNKGSNIPSKGKQLEKSESIEESSKNEKDSQYDDDNEANSDQNDEQAQQRIEISISNTRIDNTKMEMTNAEFINAKSLLEQFCKVPLLAEYSRPVAFLHPELVSVYSSIVKHPMDLSYVCRKLRRRRYYTTKQIRIDMWRIFSNCVKFHSDPSARENAIPSFISIALHLREYFNALWQEYMISSDIASSNENEMELESQGTLSSWKILLERRECSRQRRLLAMGTTPLSHGCLQKASDALLYFLENDGNVDSMDSTPLFDSNAEDDENYQFINERNAITIVQKNLLHKLHSNQEYTVDDFARDLTDCVDKNAERASQILNRLNRIIGKLIVPIYEMSCRGVNQSSIWGCMAAAIWARESSKKKYWPALVLGILAPKNQREDWHKALTERNEKRLPPKLATELKSGKKKAENMLMKAAMCERNPSNHPGSRTVEPMSYFLVEFMGKHEFAWVREADIIENFDPDSDPNVDKKKSKGSGPGSSARLFATAVNEGKWALEEFEAQLRDPCGDFSDDEEDYNEDQVVFSTLCESDDDNSEKERYNNEANTTDEEETDELFMSEGLLDLSLSGRKKAKKRLSAKRKQKDIEQKKAKAELIKKEKAVAAKKRHEMKMKRKSQQEAASKAKAQATKEAREQKKLEKEREKEERKEQRELERVKRKREKEQELKVKKRRLSSGSTQSSKKSSSKHRQKGKKSAHLSSNNSRRGSKSKSTGIPNKRSRAEAVVRHYITRIAKNEKKRGLSITGIVNPPSSGIASYGLLGMALAFRAASGVIEFPGTGKTEKVLRPWEKIDAEAPSKSSERCNLMRKQIKLLETDIKNLLANEERKKELIERAEMMEIAYFKNTKNMDKAARATCERYAKTRKKSSTSGSGDKKGKKDSQNSNTSASKRRIESRERDKIDSDDEVEQEHIQSEKNENDDEATIEVEEGAEFYGDSETDDENEGVHVVNESHINEQYEDADDYD